VRGDVSSQFLTALLLALPLVAPAADVVIEVEGELISKPYIEITLNLLARFGIAVQRDGWQRFTIPQGSRYRTPGEIHVEGDASSASYFIALGAIAAHGGAPVRIEGVGSDSIQGDIRFVDAAQAMGAQVQGRPGLAGGAARPLAAAGITLDCNHIPDAAMTLAVMALYADGPTRLTGIASWRVKETDRIAAMAGRAAQAGRRGGRRRRLHRGHPARAWRHAAIHTYDDHRMAMCLSLAAFNPLAGAARAAGAHPRPALRGQDLPRLLRGLFGVAQADPAGAGDHHRRPHRLGQGHAGAAVARAPGLPPAGLGRAVPRHRRWPRMGRRGARRRGRPGAHAGPAGPALRRPRSRTCCAARRHRRAAPGATAGLLASRVSALPAGARGAARPAAGVPPCAGPGGRRPRHGHRGLPDAR
jgi:3-phosphoshikimate 1-carboxyvinyltransferase